MKRRPGKFAPRVHINVDDMLRQAAADMERVGEENRRRIADQGHHYTTGLEWYCLARIRADGSWHVETLESVRVPLDMATDQAHRDHIMVGQLSGSGPNEQGAIAQLHWEYAKRLFERKVCSWADARLRSADLRFKIAETLGKQ